VEIKCIDEVSLVKGTELGHIVIDEIDDLLIQKKKWTWERNKVLSFISFLALFAEVVESEEEYINEDDAVMGVEEVK